MSNTQTKAPTLDAGEQNLIITRIAPGSVFSFNGQEFTLHQVANDGGFTWLNSSGVSVLSQRFYPDGLPTLADIARMARYYCPR